MKPESTEPRDLRDYIRPVLSRWWLFLLVVPIVTIGTFLYYDHKPKSYTASTELFLQPSTLNELLLGTNGGISTESVGNLSLLIQTPAVGNKAQQILKKEHAFAQGAVSASPVEETSFITVTAISPDPVGAAKLANAYAQAFVATQSRQLRGEAKETQRAAEKQLEEIPGGEATRTQRAVVEERIQTLQLIASQPGASGIKQVNKALPSAEPIAHNPKPHAIFAFVLSLMLCIGAAFGLEYLSRRLKSVEDVEEAFGLPVLSEVPKVDVPAPFEDSVVTVAKPLHEPFHRLQMNLDMLAQERELRTILIASAAPNEGKSIVTRSLALAYREAGRNVAVLDADFRKATLGRLLAAQEGPGLSDILAGRATFGDVIQEVPVPPVNGNGNGHGALPIEHPDAFPVRTVNPRVSHGDLAMVPAGMANPANLATVLASGQVAQTLQTAAEKYDRVIIDSSPLLATADVLPLLAAADGVVLVTRLGVSTRDSAQRLLRELQRVPNINLVGVVVNGIPPRLYKTRAYGYYYG